jgi:hypothetical protein
VSFVAGEFHVAMLYFKVFAECDVLYSDFSYILFTRMYRLYLDQYIYLHTHAKSIMDVMEASCSFEMQVTIYQTAWCHILEDHIVAEF